MKRSHYHMFNMEFHMAHYSDHLFSCCAYYSTLIKKHKLRFHFYTLIIPNEGHQSVHSINILYVENVFTQSSCIFKAYCMYNYALKQKKHNNILNNLILLFTFHFEMFCKLLFLLQWLRNSFTVLCLFYWQSPLDNRSALYNKAIQKIISMCA